MNKIDEKKIYSQNGEDGIILKLIELLKIKDNPYFVEFGVQSGKECNTRYIREKLNWNGIMFDGNSQNKKINLYKHFITAENIIDIFKKYNVPKKSQLLSVDIDGNDFYVLHEILKNGYSFDIIICEYNASIKPNEDKTIIYDPNFVWPKTTYYGASLKILTMLANMFNYSLVYVESTGTNAFFVKNDNLTDNNFYLKNVNNVEKLYVKGPKWFLKYPFRKCRNSLKWYNFRQAINVSHQKQTKLLSTMFSFNDIMRGNN